MYTIIMNNDKSLTTSVRQRLYQQENLVDKIQFLFPQMYEDISLKECTAILKYIDQGNVPHSEILVADSELYKDRVRCVLPVDTKLTKFAGDIVAYITIYKVDLEQGNVPVLHTGDVVFNILPRTDYFAMDTSSLQVLDQKMIQLDVKIEETESLLETVLKDMEDGCGCEDGVPSVDFTTVEPDDGDIAVDNVIEF